MLALGCLLATGSAGAAEPVFSTVFTADAGFEQEAFDLWTTIDANADERAGRLLLTGHPRACATPTIRRTRPTTGLSRPQ